MIKLLDIKKNNNIIECDILPEDSVFPVHMVVNILINSIESYSLPKGYEWCKSHVFHAKEALIRLSSNKVIPKEKLVMWY